MISKVTTHLNRYNPFLWGPTGHGSNLGVAPVVTDPSLTVWFDAVNSTYSPSNPTTGTSLTAWGDKSSAAHDANTSGNTTVQPKYQTNIQNGLPNIYFDGVNDLFTVNPFGTMQSLNGYTYFIVGKTSITTQQVITVMKANSGGDVRELYLSVNASGKWAVGAGTGLASSATVDTNYHIHTIVYDGTLGGNTRLRHRLDGVEQALTFSNTPTSLSTTNTTYLYIGTDTSGNNDFNGYLGDVAIYTKTLADADIQNVEKYFKNKWAI